MYSRPKNCTHGAEAENDIARVLIAITARLQLCTAAGNAADNLINYRAACCAF